jgi:signal transduction histidine kinase
MTLAAATVLYLAASATQGDSNAPLAIPFFAYSVGLTRPIRVSGAIVGAAALALSTSTFYGPGDPDPLVIVLWSALLATGWLVAVSIRRNQARADQLSQAVVDLQTRQAEVAAAAIAEERSRIAQELHDAVGHTVNVMVLHAGAARLSNQPAKAFDALREIEDLGRAALTDLDHLLGLLHDPVAPTRNPANTMADIAAMIEKMRAAGSDITLHDQCDRPVGRHCGAAAYRIVQEALTNSLKHAGPSLKHGGPAQIDVTLSCTERHLRIEVTDDGQPASPGRSAGAAPAGGGRGIPGMAERAKVLGGRLAAGPSEGGGFVVDATLPLHHGRPPTPTLADERAEPATS